MSLFDACECFPEHKHLSFFHLPVGLSPRLCQFRENGLSMHSCKLAQYHAEAKVLAMAVAMRLLFGSRDRTEKLGSATK
jgi:hypothetical protein